MRAVPVFAVFTAIALLAMLASLTPQRAALCYALPALPMVAWLFVRLRRNLPPAGEGVGGAARQLFGYGLRCYPNDLLTAASAGVAQIVVVTLAAPAVVGLFVVSFNLSRMLDILYTSVATVLMPSTAARQENAVVEKTAFAARLNFAASGAVALPLLIFTPVILPLLYGSSFAPAVPVARLLIIEVVISGTTWILAQAFIAAHRPGVATLLQAASLVVAAPLLGAVVPKFGALGAAAVLLGVSILKLACVGICYAAIFRVRPAAMLYHRSDVDYVMGMLRG
jgi:O-antigen/teichoic acid export membrane protein